MARALLAADGLFIGSSSAMNCVGTLRVAQALGARHRSAHGTLSPGHCASATCI